jgi:hypothetical protein
MQSSVVDIGGDGAGSLAEVLLFIADEVFCCSNNTLGLDSQNSLV